jgi:nucleoid DNA-binding protein
MASIAKGDLAGLVAEKADLTVAESTRLISALLESICEALQKGDSVRLTGFGTFRVTDTRERPGHDPRTGEPLTIAPGKRVLFSPGSRLRRAALVDRRVGASR